MAACMEEGIAEAVIVLIALVSEKAIVDDIASVADCLVKWHVTVAGVDDIGWDS